MTTLPRECYAELYLGGWTAVTPSQGQTITVTRGRQDWAGDVSPSRMKVQLLDEPGDLRPDDPTGPYFGLLNRNTPFRYGYVLLRDTFGRTVVDGWSSTTPEVVAGSVRSTRISTYTLSGTAADFDVAAGVGTMFIAANNTKRRAYLAADNAHRNIDVQVDMSLPTPGSGAVRAGIMLRGASTSSYVAVDADVNSSGTVRIAIRDHTDNVYLVAATTVSGVVATTIRMRAQVEGDTIRGKLWNTGDSEPYGWHATAVDPDMAYAGWVGLRAETSGNTNITHTFDNLIIRSPRFFGVSGKLQPKVDTTGNDKRAVVEGRGIQGRMERNTGTARSALSLYYAANSSPVAYWPLTGGSLTEAGQSAVAGQQDLVPFIGTHPSGAVFAAPQWGAGSLGPWLEPGISRAGGGSLSVLWAPVTMTGFTTAWTVDIVYSSAAGGDNINCVIDINPTYLGGPISPWIQLIINAAGGEIGVAHLSGTETFESGVTLFDGIAHHVRWTATQSGGTVNISFYIDGVLVNTAGEAGTLPAIRQIGFVAGGSGTIGFAEGHAAVFTTPPAVADTADAALGYRGETAGNRIARVCEENGIGLAYASDLDDTQVMGPQYAEPVLKVLTDAADTDFATLVESRMFDGFYLTTGRAAYAKTIGATLDFSSHQLSGEFDPAYDDQETRNTITARRRDGGQYTATQESGPNNVQSPGDDPDGVGVYDKPVTVNVQLDTQLPDTAGWQRLLGTVRDPRVPSITVDSGNQHITDLLDDALLSLEPDDRLVVTNLTTRGLYNDFSQLVRGYTETLDTIYQTKLSLVTTPESPYQVVILDTPPKGKVNTAGSVLHTAVNSSATALDVVTTSGPLWTTSGGAMPLPLTLAGEDISVTTVANEVFTFVAAGTAAHGDNASVVPGLPAGATTGDLLITLAAIRNTAATVAASTQTYTDMLTYGNVRLFWKVHTGSESAPTISFSGGAAGDTTSAQMIALRGKVHSLTNVMVDHAQLTNVSAQDIAYPGLDVRINNCVLLVIGWKQDDWTSVATLSGMTEIGEPSTTTGNDQGLVWDYVIQTTATDKAGATFVVTGGAAAVSKGIALALRCDRQALTATRSVNGVSKAQTANTPIALTRRATLGR